MVDMTAPVDPPPKYFGAHPGYHYAIRRALKRASNPFDRAVAYQGLKTPLASLLDPRHPSVACIPRNRPLWIVDNYQDSIWPDRLPFFFSSFDYWINKKDGWVFQALDIPALWRLQGLSQLGALIPDHFDMAPYVVFVQMPFTHHRWSHSMLTAAMDEVILARNGFYAAERAPHVLTAATHDIAMPTGGDTVKRIDPLKLSEDQTFKQQMYKLGLIVAVTIWI